jgi:hypothetical protein
MIEAPDAGSVAAIGAAIGEAGKAISSAASLGKGLSSYQVKINSVSESDGAGMDAEQIMAILHNLDTQGLTEAASAHEQLGAKLQQVADKLVQNAQTLSSSWQGNAAQAAMDKFQTMHNQTAQLAAQAKQTSNTLNWMAGRMQHYKSLPTPVAASATASDEQTGAAIGGTVGGAGGAALGDAAGAIAGAFGIGGGAAKAKANAQAQKYMQALSKEIVAGNQALPNTIGASTASTGASGGGTAHASAGGVGSGSVASGPGLSPYSGSGVGPGTGSGAGGHIGAFNPSQLTHGGSGPTTASLQSTATAPPPNPTTLPPTGNPGPGGPVGGPPSMPPVVPPGPNGGSGPGPNDGANAPEDPRLQSLSEENAAADNAAADNAGIDSVAAENAAADSAAANGAEGMPGMAGGSAGQSAAESAAGESLLSRESLAETDPGFAAASGAEASAIGDEVGAAAGAEGESMLPMAGAGGKQDEKERQRQAWMEEDADIWGAPRSSVGPVINN